MWRQLWEWVERWLYAPEADAAGWLAGLRRGLRYPVAVLRDLAGGELSLRAMGLVYTTLLAIIPAVALSFVVLRTFGLHHDLEPLLLEFFRPVGDGAADLTRRVMRFADGVRTGLVGSVGFALLLWTLMGTVKKVEDCLNFVWHVRRPRRFARRVAEYIGLLVAGPVVVVAVIGFSKLTLDSANALAVAELPFLARRMRIAIELAPYALVTALFTAIYLIMPNTRVRLGPAFGGALCAGILWATTGKLFTAMVVYTSRLTLIYAGFAIIGAVLLWTYLGWIILLAGAQLSFYLQHSGFLRLGLGRPRLSGVETELLGLNLMALVARDQAAGRPLWTVDTLCREMQLPGVAVADAVEALARAGLLQDADGERLAPARDPGGIRITQILDAMRAPQPGRMAFRLTPLPAVREVQAGFDAAWRSGCGTQTLRDLLESAPA
jgi:membrane protein